MKFFLCVILIHFFISNINGFAVAEAKKLPQSVKLKMYLVIHAKYEKIHLN